MKEVHLSFHTNEDNPNPLLSVTITDLILYSLTAKWVVDCLGFLWICDGI
jgi:hypothetical protein